MSIKPRILSIFNSNIELYSKYYKVRDISIRIHDKHVIKDAGERDVAWADPRDRTVNFISRAMRFDINSIQALMRHEIAHLCDEFVDKENREQRADDIAFLVCGDKIRYDRKLIQTIECSGVFPRPDFLPK